MRAVLCMVATVIRRTIIQTGNIRHNINPIPRIHLIITHITVMDTIPDTRAIHHIIHLAHIYTKTKMASTKVLILAIVSEL